MKEASPKVTLPVAEATALDEASANVPTVSAPRYIPTTPSLPSDSAPLAAGLYPMIFNVLPNPAAMQPGGGRVPPVLHGFTNQPWNPRDSASWGSKMPRLREDAEEMRSVVFLMYAQGMTQIGEILNF